jgi:hypothetical protein
MRFTVVLVSTGGGELHSEGITLFAKLVIHGDGFLGHSRGNGILVEYDIVRATLVVGPFDSITGADGGLGRNEDELSRVGSHLDILGLGSVSWLADSSDSNTSSQTSGTSHGRTTGAVIVGSNNRVEIVVKLLPIKGGCERSLKVVLEGTHHWVHASTGGADTAMVSSGALGTGKKGEELTLSSFDDHLEVELHLTFLFDTTERSRNVAAKQSNEHKGLEDHGFDMGDER